MKHLFDYHVHSDVSSDCDTPMFLQVERGIELGLKEICFTEHLDFDPIDYSPRLSRPGDARDGYLDAAGYERKFAECCERYSDRITLLKGVEAGEMHRFAATAREVIGSGDYDLVLGSVHNLYEFAISAPWPKVPVSEVTMYRDYFEQAYLLAKHHDFDVLGHLDIIKRYGTVHYGSFDPLPYEEQIREILRALIQRGKGLEINTSGLRQAAKETMPGMTVLRWYRALGGEVLTIGSDSHHHSVLGYGLDTAREMALTAGFNAFTTFRKRKALFRDFA